MTSAVADEAIRPKRDEFVWTGWRGPERDGLVPWLPAAFPDQPKIEWTLPLTGDGLAGVAATLELVIVADRDFLDTHDVWRCLDAALGLELWTVTYRAEGQLDYGNSPRATPLIHGDFVYLQGAFGHLLCVELASGEIVWQRDLLADFDAELPIWGLCGSPLIAGGNLIVNPGGPQAFLAALDPATGETRWTTPGRTAAYASFIEADLGGRRQLVGYDKVSLGGWDVETGRRLWELKPAIPGDFNVPTPVVVEKQLLVTTENNGTRLYGFNDDGTIVPQPKARYERLAADSSTAVVIDGRVFGVWNDLHCLSAENDLEPLWRSRDRVFRDYASLIAAPGRVLVTTTSGELILVDSTSADYNVVGRMPVIADDSEVHAHPALAGTRLYVRSASSILCVNLGDPGPLP
ncbi:MAG: hypothetical protein DWQ29_07965 [Planctomycetota bacterium]|nr:MAG: hypothetical protein DWQ29_07965 [Planctomycetota bacterium]